MKRTSITIDDDLLRLIEFRFGKKEFINFSAVIRKLLRDSYELNLSYRCAGCEKESSVNDLQYTEQLGFLCPLCGSPANRIEKGINTATEGDAHETDNSESS